MSTQPRPFVAISPMTLGWLIALLVLVVAVVLLFIGVPDPKVLLILIALLAIARLI